VTFDAAIDAHDRAVREAGLVLWLGGEPTFTDPASTDRAWLGAAEGSDKLARALGLFRRLRRPGELAVRTVGRQYPDEDAPRWSLGLYRRRDGSPIWGGPPDPALLDTPPPPGDPVRLRDALAGALDARAVDVEGPQPHRLVIGAADEVLLRRPPLEGQPIPLEGLRDEVAAAGARLFTLGVEDGCVVLELPAYRSVDLFAAFLGVLAGACRSVELPALILRGHPPPVDDRVAFATITPDPGVIEVNMAPCRSVAELYAAQRAIHAAAVGERLSARRRHFNGEVTDSGGGGHLTFGGRHPEQSPFFVHPHLLPRLLSYLSHHPSLSYWFAGRAVGGSGQAVRPDEQARESFDELGVALARLAGEHAPKPDALWGSLAPLLTDRFGNTHRSEVNVEKLFNPWLPGRGKLGVVELRALRQAPSPEHDVARAALFRSVLARLVKKDYPVGLRDWGTVLHDRFALPYYLAHDLGEVLDDVERAGFGLDEALVAEILDDGHRRFGEAELDDGVRLEVRRAVEFWPLVGDLSQQNQTTRLVDASTTRLELRLVGPQPGTVRVGVRVGDRSYLLPMVQHEAGDQRIAVFGVRYRTFAPRPGLHPSLEPVDPLVVDVVGMQARRIALHSWIPGGGVYPALPADDEEAARRRADRMVITDAEPPRFAAPPRSALSRFALDTRRIR